MDSILNLIDQTPIKSSGNSMEPLLYDGDVIYIEKIKKNLIDINNILLIKKGQLFIHRVIYKNRRYLITKGDNNSLSDGKIKPNQILGRVFKIKRGKNFYKLDDIYLIQSGYYLKEIIKIKNLFEKNGIKYVFLKGLPLHLFFEGTHPKRLYFDCDILVDRKNLTKIKQIFSSQGYKQHDIPLENKKPRHEKQEIAFQKIINGLPVNFDVHFEPVFMMTQLGHLEALYPKKLLDQMTEEFMENKRTVKINNNFFPILSKTDLIIYLALHFFHHNFQGAFRLDFLNKVIRQSRLKRTDWIKIQQKINKFNLENFLTSVFFLLKKYCQTPLPDFIKDKKIEVNIFDSESRISSGIARFRNLLFLSPYPLSKKLFVFANPEVISSIFFISRKKLSYFLRGFSKNR